MVNTSLHDAQRRKYSQDSDCFTDEELGLAYWKITAGKDWLVFIHGNSACKEVFYGQMHAFSELGYSVLAVDLLGHGASERATLPSQQYTIPGYASAVKTLLSRLQIAKPVLVGWSLGGHIAMEMLGQSADVLGVSLCGTPPVGIGLDDFGSAFLASSEAQVTGQREVSDEALYAYLQAVYGSLSEVPELFSAMGVQCDGLSRECMVADWATGQSGHCQRAIVASSMVPIQVIHGCDDKFVNIDYLEQLSWNRLHNNEIVKLAGLGHAPFLESPAQYNQYLANFLKDIAV